MAKSSATPAPKYQSLDDACAVLMAVHGGLQELAEQSNMQNTLYALSNALEPVQALMESLRCAADEATGGRP